MHQCSESKCSATVQSKSLKEAIAALQLGQTLTLPAGYYTGSGSCGINILKDGVTIRGSGRVIIDCAGRDRHFTIASDNVRLEGLELVNGWAGIKTCSNSSLSINECFLDHSGGCVLSLGRNLSVHSSSLSRCVAGRFGGGIAAVAGLYLTSVEISSSQSGRGGAAWSLGTLRVESCNFESNNAMLGGALALQGSTASLMAANSRVSENHATYLGGGLLAEGELELSFEDSSIEANSAGWQGGGAALSSKAVFKALGVTRILNNKALGDLSSANFGGSGGGIYASGGVNVLLSGKASIENNSAPNGFGGGLALSDGSSLVLDGGSEVARNDAMSGGGAAVFGPGSVRLFNDSHFRGNSAADRGGALMLQARMDPVTPADGPLTLELRNRSGIRGNSARNGGGVHGVFKETSVLVTDRAEVGNNYASVEGGGMFLQNGVTFRMDGQANLSENTAYMGGGGINAVDDVSLVVMGQATAVRGYSQSDFGGCFRIMYGSSLVMGDDVQMTHCLGSWGAGIYGLGSDLNLSGRVLVARNSAYGDCGAGVYLEKGSNMVASDHVKFFDNDGGDGGAICISTFCTVLLKDDVRVERNSVWWNGGGLHVESFPPTTYFEIRDRVVIRDNYSGKRGGAISVWGGTKMLVTGDVQIVDNYAVQLGGGISGVAMRDGASIVLAGRSVTARNYADSGAAIYAGNNWPEVRVTGDAVVRDNWANRGGALYLDRAQKLSLDGKALLTNNSASGDGGCVYVQNVQSLSVGDSLRMTQNRAGGNGGGLYVAGSHTSFTMAGEAVLERNRADKSGGGMFLLSDTAGSLRVEGSSRVEGNTASVGGGLCLDGLFRAVLVDNAKLLSNNATMSGGGVALR